MESLVAGLLLGAAHGTDLRVDEGHTRDGVVAGDVGGVPAEDDVPTKPALVLVDVSLQPVASTTCTMALPRTDR